MATWRTQVQHDGTWTGGPGFNVFHFRDADSGDPLVQLQAAADALETFYAGLAPLFPATSTFSHNGEWLDIAESTVLETEPWSADGSASGGYAPAQTCIVAGWRTSVRTRSGRGRTFLGPPALSTAQSDGTIVETALSGVRARATELATFGQGLQRGSFVVYSPTEGVARDMVGASVRDVFAHLTSRRG